MGDRENTFNGEAGARTISHSDAGVYGDRTWHLHGAGRTQMKKESANLHRCPLPPRDWNCESTIGTRLTAAMRWLETGTTNLPSLLKSDRRDRSTKQVQAQWRGAVARTVALNKAADDYAIKQNSALGYISGELRGDYCLLDSELAAVPEPSLAATADLKDILAPQDQHLISKDFLIKPQSEWPPMSSLPVHLGVKSGHYARLLKRMKGGHMITFLPTTSSAIENSVFGVWKVVGKSQRVIWGGNRSNPLFSQEASAVELPTPDLLATLQLPPNRALYLGSCDLSQYFNRLRAPDFLIPYLGLPKIRRYAVGCSADTDFVIPCLRCIPMGATFAVRIAQAASLEIIRRSGLIHALVTVDNSELIKGLDGRIIVYIDDITVIGNVASGVNRSTDTIIQAFADHHLPDAEDKRQIAPLSGPGEALGLWWWPEGYLTVKPQLSRRLLCETEEALGRGFLSSQEMRHLLGLWIWPCLLHRSILPVLDSSFSFITEHESHRRRRLPRAVRTELNMLLDLFPLMYADLRIGTSRRVYASDASTKGAGVVYCDLTSQKLRNFPTTAHETQVRKGWHSVLHSSPDDQHDLGSSSDHKVSRAFKRALERMHFLTAISTGWQHEQHINLLEATAATSTVRHMHRSPATRDRRVILLRDNSTALGALGKGRSSSSALNTKCRRFAAAQIRGNIRIQFHWVLSNLNRADEPSRAIGHI